MLRPALRHLSTGAAGALAVLVLAGGGLAFRLSQGPIAANVLRPAVERWLELGTGGGKAEVGAVDVAWFDRSRALGLRLQDVSVRDGRGRSVLTARALEAGVAADSVLALRPAAGRIGAQDFFAAISISPEGRFALGYDAAGAPRRAGDLWRYLEDLTGRTRFGRPLSFLREVDLDRGTVAFRQVGGPVQWRGRIDRVHLSKARGALDADIALAIDKAALRARAQGLVGLKRATMQARLSDLYPARVFPTVGFSKALSALDAPVQGEAALSWSASDGVKAADIELQAGQGAIRLAGEAVPFQSGVFDAAFDTRSQRVLIRAARADADRAAFDAAGEVWLIPESRASGPARIEVALRAPSGRLALAPGAEAQPVANLFAQGRFIPASGRIDIDRVTAAVAGVPLTISGALVRPGDQRSWGVDLKGRLDGMLSAGQVLALWPNGVGDDARSWLLGHVQGGRLGKAEFTAHLKPGDIQPHRPIPDERIQLTYAFEDAAVSIFSRMPAVEHVAGTGLLKGDSYSMTVRTASIQGVGLGQGEVRIPRLMGGGLTIEVAARAQGDAREILDIVDRSTGGVPSAHGFAPARLSGRADIGFQVDYPMGSDTPLKGEDVTYAGIIRDAVVEDAALGLTLRASSVNIKGSLDGVDADGQVRLGPYRGPLTFASDFPAGKQASQKAEFDGLIDASTVGLSGPAGSTMRFAARFESQGDGGRGVIRSKGFDGQTIWTAGPAGRFTAQGTLNAKALRAIGLPVGKGLSERTPARLILMRSASGWTGALDADAYSGSLVFTGGDAERLRYAAQLTPAEAQKLGLEAMAGGQPMSITLDVSMKGETGQAAYGLGAWLGHVSWSQTTGARTQYRWNTTLTAADLHALGLPAGIEPKAPLPIDVVLTSSGGGWSGTAQTAGGTLRFASSPPAGGRRRLSVTGQVDGEAAADLGLWTKGMISGPAGVSAQFDLACEGLRGGRMELDLQKAAINAPFVPWKKPAGRAMRISADFVRHADDGWEATAIRGSGPGFGLSGQGQWRANAGGVLRIANARLEGAFDGALDFAVDSGGRRLSARARYFDARRLIQQGGQGGQGGGAAATAAANAPSRPLHVDAQLAQVRVSEASLVRNVSIQSDLGGGGRDRVEIAVARDGGDPLIKLHLFPDAAGMAIAGQVSDVGEAARVLFDRSSFKGGQATVNGRLVPGGADLKIEMTKVRLVRASSLARILTVGSLHGMADTVNGAGIEFTKITAPVSIRGAKLIIGRARATGPAMGVTTQGVIDVDNHTVDLSGGIAPSYVLNSAMGSVPVLGGLLVSHKGEGMFGLTYSAKGAFASPKISVNPFSLATPGILRRLFEGRSAAAKLEEGG